MNEHELWMKEAIIEAEKAAALNEVPIGAVIVHEGRIVGRGHNVRETSNRALSHAELMAIEEANVNLGTWRLLDCQLYVTLEPCPMCAGAIIQARIGQLIYGASDPKAGCAGTLMNLLQESRFNHQTETISGVMQEECSALLTNFFRNLRKLNAKTSENSSEKTNGDV